MEIVSKHDIGISYYTNVDGIFYANVNLNRHIYIQISDYTGGNHRYVRHLAEICSELKAQDEVLKESCDDYDRLNGYYKDLVHSRNAILDEFKDLKAFLKNTFGNSCFLSMMIDFRKYRNEKVQNLIQENEMENLNGKSKSN